MVCDRCKSAVRKELAALGYTFRKVELGEVDLDVERLEPEQLKQIDTALNVAGFELIDDRKSRITEKIKNLAVNLVHHTPEQPRENYSELIAKELHHDYPYLSKIFSETEGITIEQYIIKQRIEKVKEYLEYDELNLGEIADKMGYSSSAHLSAQFKKVTGTSPTQFKNMPQSARKPLDKVGGTGA